MARTALLLLLVLGALVAFALADDAADVKDGKLKIGVKFRPEKCERKTEVDIFAMVCTHIQ